ncbi:MAG: glycosyltransferase family 4 protein [Patescibacteria group bacterium]|nr:glycosyltransferase family 4 protein [Patescibacteria group bacterium]
MKVLIATGLYPPEVGGPATYTRVLETELPRSGITVSVLPFSRVRRLPKIIRHVSYCWHAFRMARDADIVYAQDPVSVGFPAMLAAKLSGKPFLLKVVGDYAWEQASQRWGFAGTPEEFQHAELSIPPKFLRALERFIARQAVRVVVPSKYLARIVSTWGVEKKRLVVIYNGMEKLADAGNKPVLRGLLKFRGKLIVSIGRLVPWKGFRELIVLLERMKKDMPDLKLMIIGSGPDMAELEAEAAARGLADDVIFTGALPRDVLLRYVRLSDVFVLNTRYEGFSHQILEVMAVGVPVVTTAIGGNPEAILNEKNGFLVTPNDLKKMEQIIVRLLTDATLRARITAAGKRTVAGFTNERMARETAALLKQAAG